MVDAKATHRRWNDEPMPAAPGGPRLLLRRLREAMAEPVSPQARLDRIVVLIAANTHRRWNDEPMPAAPGGPRLLLRRLREAMAEPV
ncbi:hypothetical protein CTI14_13400, partial [Methylobacterium radiotolerans]